MISVADHLDAITGHNPDRTAMRYFARIDRLSQIDDGGPGVDEELAYWAWREGGQRDLGGEG